MCLFEVLIFDLRLADHYCLYLITGDIFSVSALVYDTSMASKNRTTTTLKLKVVCEMKCDSRLIKLCVNYSVSLSTVPVLGICYQQP